MKEHIVLHVDFDYFYAQCEEVRNHDLKAKPVVVCMFSDRGNDSGAVATAIIQQGNLALNLACQSNLQNKN